jgi:putative tryptophan/tyrosine transport system substrate-binding protein
MKRRVFLSSLLAGLASPRTPVRAQQAGRPRRVGIIDDGPLWDYFRERLRELGDVDGQSVATVYRIAEGNPDRLLAAARELARLPVDVIAVAGSPAAQAAKAATDTVPIVAMVVGDPVAIGIAKNWERPEGNVTGSMTLGPDLAAKRLQLLKNVVPHLSRMAYFWNPNNASSRTYLEQLRVAGQSIGVTIVSVEARAAAEFDSALATLAKSGVEAMLASGDAVQQRNVDLVIQFQLKHHLPGMFPRREDVVAGGLMSYGASAPDLYRRGAVSVHKILRGARPAELPFEHPTRLELVINLGTAEALRLAVPRAVLRAADEIVE